MSDFETLLRDRIARGEMTHLSLVPTQGGKMWRATYSPSSVFGHQHAEDADPLKAMILAMDMKGLKRMPAKVALREEPLIPQETVDVVEPDALADYDPTA